MGHHAFTVEEANAMLPDVRAALDQIQSLRDVPVGKMDQLAVLDVLWGDLVSQSGNPDREEYAQHQHSLADCRRAIEELIQERLLDRGVRFRSAVSSTGWSTFRPRWTAVGFISAGRQTSPKWRIGTN